MQTRILLIVVVTVLIIGLRGPSDVSAQGSSDEYKTFTSPEFKFSIEYPVDMEPYDLLDDKEIPFVSFSGILSEKDSSFLFIHPNDKTLEQFIELQLAEKPLIGGSKQMLDTPTSITVNEDIGGLEFSYTILGDSSMTRSLVFAHDDHIYNFMLTGATSAFNENQYDHMIDSIKFFD